MNARIPAAIAFSLILAASAWAQDATPAPATSQTPPPREGGTGWQGQRGGGRGAWGAGMGQGRSVMGTVTEVAGDHYTVKTDAGDVYTVHYSANTHIIKAPPMRRGEGGAAAPRDRSADAEAGRGQGPGQGPQVIKATDIKVGDFINAGGEIDANAKSIGAVFISQLDPEQVKAMRDHMAAFGKTWLGGRVTAVDGVKVTVKGGPGDASHTFVADENTTFRKRRDPITLGDIQVGDMVNIEGAVKEGNFVASSVQVMGAPGGPGERGGAGAPPIPPQ